jgi:hypothetical protein
MVFKVVRGNPTAEELAAALAVVQRRVPEPAAGSGGRLRVWADPARVAVRHLPRAGRGAWRSTFWPH